MNYSMGVRVKLPDEAITKVTDLWRISAFTSKDFNDLVIMAVMQGVEDLMKIYQDSVLTPEQLEELRDDEDAEEEDIGAEVLGLED